MLDLKKTYVVDEQNRRIAVQIDIETFERIEEALENYGLTQVAKANPREETLSLDNRRLLLSTTRNSSTSEGSSLATNRPMSVNSCTAPRVHATFIFFSTAEILRPATCPLAGR